jgi:hypothetical protein
VAEAVFWYIGFNINKSAFRGRFVFFVLISQPPTGLPV